MPTGLGASPAPDRSASERWPWPNAGDASHALKDSSSRQRVTTSQVVRSSVGFSNSKPSKPSWLSTAPARAANLRASSSPLSAGTVIALILITVIVPEGSEPRSGGHGTVTSMGESAAVTRGSDNRPVVAVANRLPVHQGDDGWELSPGGLVTALRPVMATHPGAWVGWDGGSKGMPARLPDSEIRLLPVGLSAAQV